MNKLKSKHIRNMFKIVQLLFINEHAKLSLKAFASNDNCSFNGSLTTSQYLLQHSQEGPTIHKSYQTNCKSILKQIQTAIYLRLN